jgi:uncharacterized membrane protein
MHKPRFDALVDGMFAIVMTLLVIEIRVPELHGLVTNESLFYAILDLRDLFGAYLLSFLVLSTYWMAHHYLMTLIATNITRPLVYSNIPFLATIALIPFSSHLLGAYPDSQVAIAFYGVNVILIGIFLYIIREYILRHPSIQVSDRFTQKDHRIGFIRIWLPPLLALIAIGISFYSPALSIAFFVSGVIVNLIPSTVHLLDRCARTFVSKKIKTISK